MPNVLDSTEAGARRLLMRLKVVPTVMPRDTNAADRDGRVFAQRPAAGRPLLATDTVVLGVYRYVPAESVYVPPVTGRPLLVALRILGSTRLTPRYPRLGQGDLVRGTVSAQFPAPKTRVAAGDTVVLTVDLTTVVPQVLSLDVPTATQVLASNGLVLKTAGTVYSDSAPLGRVVRQHPDSGTQSRSGATVDVWISLGQHVTLPQLKMPNLLGLTLVDAVDTLRVHRLLLSHVDSVTDPSRAGQVVEQQPQPDMPLHRTDPVTVRVAVAPPLRRVPWVMGMAREMASQLLQDAGFVARIRMVEPGATGAKRDLVIAQRPDSGQLRPPMSVVILTVTDTLGPTGPTPIAMPSVVGLTRDAATDTLGFLSPGITIIERPTTVASDSDRVLAQAPVETVLVLPGLAVVLTVGRYEPQRQRQDTSVVANDTVPDLIGRRMREARRLLAAANLRLGDVTGIDVTPDSLVVRQEPGPRTPVPPGALVAVELQQATQQGSPDGSVFPWWIVWVAGGGLAAYVAYRIIRPRPNRTHPGSPVPRVHVQLKQPPLEPPKVIRVGTDPVVRYEVTLVNRAPELSIDAPDTLIAREEVV